MTPHRLGTRYLGALAFTASAFAACATNPVTGRRELSLISESQEIEMGRQAAAEASQSIGLVKDQALQDYVQRVGAQMATQSERPGLPWTFRVVDDPTPNAFALPGGFIFVTRGLLTLMNNEAELATVLGHEIGHVTARHSVSQLSKAQVAQIGLGVGMILSPTLRQLGDVAGTGMSLLFLKYGRDDERQADELGFRYALNENYDVREMADVFATLERAVQVGGQSPLPNWLASHPGSAERVAAARSRVASLNRPLDNLKRDEADYAARLEGLVYGENPRNGFFENGRFYHPDLRFVFQLPSGWKAQNLAQAVVAMSPQEDAAMQLTLAGTSGAQAAAQQFLSQQGIQAGQPTNERINGIPAVASYFQAQTDQGVIRGMAAWLDYGGNTYQFIAYAPEQRFATHESLLRQSLGSFAQLTDQRALNVQPNRLRVVHLQQPMTLAEFNSRYPSVIKIEELAIINQVEGPNSRLPAGAYVKRVSA